MYYTWKNVEKSYKNNKFKISAPTWNEEFGLPDGSYFISDIQGYFEYILKKHRRNCFSIINNTEIDNAKNIDVVMPVYNLIECSDNY